MTVLSFDLGFRHPAAERFRAHAKKATISALFWRREGYFPLNFPYDGGCIVLLCMHVRFCSFPTYHAMLVHYSQYTRMQVILLLVSPLLLSSCFVLPYLISFLPSKQETKFITQTTG